MTTDDGSGALHGPFVEVSFRGARFVRSDLSATVMRGVDLAGADIDSPWLLEAGSSLLVNGVDVVPLLEAELNRRFPGRSERWAEDPDGLRTAWASVERAWAGTLARAEAMPPGTVDVSVDGEWSLAQTLRHLVMATDVWLRRAVLEVEQPYHPVGLPNAEYATDGHDPSAFSSTAPSWAEVLAARADRVAMVRSFLATVTTDDLAVPRANPWAPAQPETTRSCLRTILEEEWEHHRYAVRDLDVIAQQPCG
ncbi:MAG: DinB family protein [Terracoccus sp.]